MRSGRPHLAELVGPSRGEQGTAKFVHESVGDLCPYHVCEDFKSLCFDSAITFLPDPRTNTFRDVHDTFHVALYEREYAVVQTGKWVTRLVEARRSRKRRIKGVCTRSEGCKWRMGGPCCVGKCVIVA
jgi:hypothetical protein